MVTNDPVNYFQIQVSSPQGYRNFGHLSRDSLLARTPTDQSLTSLNAAEAARYIEFLRLRVKFLPSQTPEALVWSDSEARKIVNPLPRGLTVERDLKRRIVDLAAAVPAYDENTVFRTLLRAFLVGASLERRQLRDLISSIRNA